MNRIVLYFFLLGILSAPIQLGSAEPKPLKLKVLSSIKPIQAIVTAIGGDYVKSDLLIPVDVSPHHYTYKPSDIRKIQKADVVFRIDEHFETMFNSVFENLDDTSKVVSLAENPKIILLPISGRHDLSHEHRSSDHDNIDTHIFTSPQNALVMAKEIADELSRMDVNNASKYNKNLQVFNEAMSTEIKAIKSKLEAVKDKPYIVFHNSWQYFSEYFDLQKPTVIELHEGVSAGVKSIIGIRKEISEKGIKCVFSEPGTSTKQLTFLTESFDVKIEEINVMETSFKMMPDGYITWLSVIGSKIERCLNK